MSAKDLIDARPETIGSLITFSSNSETILVPSYQRSYRWDGSRTVDLLRLSDPDNTSFGFIGTMVFVRGEGRPLEVVDGQQRLITTILILAAFRDFIEELVSESDVEDIVKQLSAMRDDIQQETLLVRKIYKATDAKYRIEFSRSTFDFFKKAYLEGEDHSIPTDDVEKKEARALEENYREALGYLRSKYNVHTKDLVALLNKRLEKLKGLVVNAIYIAKSELAGEVFESINGTGVTLKLSELVKNYVYRNVNQQNVENKWEQINVNCGHKTDLIETVIKYDWQSRFDITDDFEVFRSIRSNTKDADDYFSRILELSHVFAFYADPSINSFKRLKLSDNSNDKNKIISYARILGVMKVKQFMRVVFALHQLTKYIDTKTYTKLLDMIVTFHVRAKVSSIQTNVIDSMYSGVAKSLLRLAGEIEDGKIPTGKIKERISTELFDKMLSSMKKLSSDELFREEFPEFTRPKNNKDIFKYILSKIENHLQRSELIVDVLDNGITLEEVYPQSPSGLWDGADLGPEDTYKIGNATILRDYDNRKAANLGIAQKVIIYKESKLRINMDLVDFAGSPPKWTKSMVSSRGASLADIALSIWRL